MFKLKKMLLNNPKNPPHPKKFKKLLNNQLDNNNKLFNNHNNLNMFMFNNQS